jgi:hypothetical protein
MCNIECSTYTLLSLRRQFKLPRVATDLTKYVARAAVLYGPEVYISNSLYKAMLVLAFTESGLVLKSKESVFMSSIRLATALK